MNCKDCIHYGVCASYEELLKHRGEYYPFDPDSFAKACDFFAKKTEWISVEDGLPTPFVVVLAYIPDNEPHPTVREGFVNKRGEWYAGGYDRLPDEVVAWRETPEPPKNGR